MTGVRVLVGRNIDVEAVSVHTIEGEPVYGGALLVKPLLQGGQMTLLEARYAPGVGAPPHVHGHESVLYVVSGKVRTVVGTDEYVLGPGDACRHPDGASHSVEAIEDSVVVEIKSPAPQISSFLGT